MKKTVAVALILMMAVIAHGELRVAWRADAGFYWVEDDSPLLTNPGDQTIAQLVWTPTNVRQIAGPGGGFYGTGDNVVIAQTTITNTGSGQTEWAWFPPVSTSEPFQAGWVYARIFQDDDVQVGDWFFATETLALIQMSGPDLPQTIQMNTDTTWGDPINTIDGSWTAFSQNPGDDLGVTGVAQVIPEPATALMLILGGMGAWMFRRSKIKSQQEQEA